MKSILITGAAGFIGSRLAEYIINTHPEYNVIGIDNLLGGYLDNLPKGCTLYDRDLATDDIEDIFELYDIEYVYHLAAYAAEGLSPFIRRFNYMNNMVATANVVNACINFNVRRLIFTSSMSVYGHGNMSNSMFTENDIPAPIDPYGVAKYSCEQDIRIAGIQHGLDWCIIRPHNVYGENQNIWDKYRNVLGIWINKINHNLPISIYGDGNQVRAFSYIDNCLPCLWNAAVYDKASKQIINLGGLKEYTINEAADILMNITGYHDKVYLEKRHEVFFAYPDGKKSIDILDYKEDISFEEGLTNMWNWAKNIKDRKSFIFDNYEVEKNIYSYWKK